ncbi:hypothetical protein mflW37_3030 [Mesoplasma florum W37]|uniref:Uncharacterized protein n=1 Tax=Mesoplasma florum TaxID=2151 RepID=A0AAD0MNA5_MESFO|nr:hypothetical protein [Mesoplasma florum]AGY41370.1 hypothetical protein mflW37_3030 [Mesoplasma florum W37]AVN59593.1 hypothetical protein CG008_01585 [Mesoplasma florum]AVN65710.1 hypothetical protein MflW12_3050 [Mesoplasma florum]
MKNLIILNFESKNCKTEKNFFDEISKNYKHEILEKFNIVKINVIGIELSKKFILNIKQELKSYLPLIRAYDDEFTHYILITIDRDIEEKFNLLVNNFSKIEKVLYAKGFNKTNINIKFLLLPQNTNFEYLICMLFDKKDAAKIKVNLDFIKTSNSLLHKVFKNKNEWINGPVVRKIQNQSFVKNNVFDNLRDNLSERKKIIIIPNNLKENSIINYHDFFN